MVERFRSPPKTATVGINGFPEYCCMVMVDWRRSGRRRNYPLGKPAGERSSSR